ncbi:MAG TPA: DUF418 domain-containing protein [Kofleriaceae bacterium]
MAELTPVGARERVVSLDVLRGLALCGVLMGNLLWLYTLRFATPHDDSSAVDTIARVGFGLVVEQKAMMLLTLLFGFGFANILVRAKERGERGTGVFVRRLAVLFVLGWCHIALVWWGDITWAYAIGGFGLLLFRRVSNIVRLVVGLVLTIVPFTVWIALDGGRIGQLFLSQADWIRHMNGLIAAAQHGDYLDTVHAHLVFALVWQAPMWIQFYPSLVGRFLLGYVAGAQRWFERDGADHLVLFRRLAIGGLAIGVPCALLTVSMPPHFDLVGMLGYELRRIPFSLLYTLQHLALAAAYVGIVVLLVQRPRWRRVLAIIAPAGRMPLTTYVLQSVFATALFYTRGLGLGLDPPGAAGCLGIALAIFAGEVAIAHVWLRYFRFGPLEWLWRSLVYMKRQPMRV